MKLHSPLENDFSNIELIGLAIKSSPRGQNHIGLLFKDGSEHTKIWHFGPPILLEDPELTYFWMNLGSSFEDIDKVIIHTFLLAEYEYLNDVFSSYHYGLDEPQNAFDDDGRLALYKSMTCASFILILFHLLGYSLVVYEDWPAQDAANKEWQLGIINLLFSYGQLSEGQRDEQLKKIGNRRFLPQEVAAATQLAIPASFSKVNPVAIEISRKIAV